jgi:hypothetical protein
VASQPARWPDRGKDSNPDLLISIKALVTGPAACCAYQQRCGATPTMSTTQPNLSGDSGHNHLKPFLTGFIICAVVGFIALLLTGLPH